ncbi:MAG: ETC complex I subunit [Alphaproteobacteria bacterium]
MEVRIYQPSKTAMQSGRAKTHHWVLEFVSDQPLSIDSLMGWTGSRETRRQVLLRFDTKEEAIAYAKRQGYAYTVEEPQERVIRPKSYAENFIRRV